MQNFSVILTWLYEMSIIWVEYYYLIYEKEVLL